MKLLIIDDDSNIVQIWTDAFKESGIEVLHAAEGRSGLDSAKVQKPDFILIDQIIPDMQGMDILKILKEDPDTSPIPMAIASNYYYPELKQAAIELGAIDYILKYDITPTDLVGVIKKHIQENQSIQ